MMLKNVLITGVSGYIGTKIAEALAARPEVATIVGIDIRKPSKTPDKLKFVKQDVRDPAVDLMNAHRIDTVVHAAYVLTPIHDTALMEDINVAGTRNILAAAARAGVQHLLYTSSTTAYGFYPDNPVPLTEESPLRGNGDFTYAKNKREIESIIAAYIDTVPEMAVTVLRPCFVVGPGFDNPLARYLQKKIVILPTETAPLQFVHEDDLVRAMIKCLEDRITGVFNIAGDGTLPITEAVEMLGNIVLPVPAKIMYPLNQLFWWLRFRFITEFPSPGINLIRFPWIAAPDKFKEATGFKYEYTSRSAFEDFVRRVKNGK